MTQPQWRTCPIRKDHIRQLHSIVCAYRAGVCGGQPGELHQADVHIISDGGKSGRSSMIVKHALPSENVGETSEATLHVYNSAASVVKNRERDRGWIPKLWDMYLVTSKNSPVVPSNKKRSHFDAPANSEILGPVPVVDWDDPSTWALPRVLKHAVYGETNRIAVGGGCPEVRESKKRAASAR